MVTLLTNPAVARVPADSNGGEMLVLTRKTNQSIMIGDDVEVSVLAVSRDKIRLGITAPRDVPVFRKEVYLSIKEEQMASEAGASQRVESALDQLSTDK
jgi:carbon storage regulator